MLALDKLNLGFWNMAYTLQYKEGGQDKSVEIAKSEFLIGRAPDCDLILAQPGISRHHCRIIIQQGSPFIEDMKSKNGTRVNNIYVAKNALSPGDTVILAEFQLTFQEVSAPAGGRIDHSTDQMVLLSEQKELQEEAGTIIRQVSEVQDLLAQEEGKTESRRIMTVVIEVAKALIAVKNTDEIINKLMDLIFDHLPADRGFLMLRDEHGELSAKVIKSRAGEDTGTIEISRTIANKALNDKCAILTTDAQVDPRFKAGESIRFLGIKSAMCVPLFHKKKSIGIIYLDCPTSSAIFSRTDLDLLTAMANFAAVGIEQAQLAEKIQRESSVRERLERYHSPNIVNRILKDIAHSQENGVNLSAEEREVTILFADIVGFTPFSERCEPAKIAELLNEYFSEMTDVIFKHEGTLDKYIGDAIMAVFGAPNTMEDHAFRAVSTGLEMLERLEKVNANRSEEYKFRIRIGINTGRAVAGDIGSIKRMEYTVLGNTVNMASRIESSACKALQVVVGEPTFRAVEDKVQAEDLGQIQLKGISEKVNVYRIHALK